MIILSCQRVAGYIAIGFANNMITVIGLHVGIRRDVIPETGTVGWR